MDITDAQRGEIILSIPWTFGELNDDGEACYSESEVQSLFAILHKLEDRAEAAEAEVERLRGSNLAEDVSSMNNAIASLHQHQVLDARRIDAIEQRLAEIDGSVADLAVGTPTMASFDALVMVVAGIERTVSALRRLAEAQHD